MYYSKEIKKLRLVLKETDPAKNKILFMQLLECENIETLRYIRDQLYNLRKYYEKRLPNPEKYESLDKAIELLAVVFEKKLALDIYREKTFRYQKIIATIKADEENKNKVV